VKEFLILAYRFCAGEALSGRHHTDATFFRWPTKVKHPRGRVVPHWWHWRPGWHRGLMRLAALGVSVALIAGLVRAPSATLIALAAVPAAAAAWAGIWVYRKVRRWWPSTSK
jgi:hypothetical protein